MELPKSAVDQDHRLEKQAESTSAELAKHRWHWTLDESNPKRVTFSQYARDVGRSATTIRSYANGYSDYTESRGSSTLVESIERSGMNTEKAVVVETIAKVRGQTFAHTRRQRPEDIREVAALARERVAEKPNTTFEKEVKKIVEATVKDEEADQRATDRRLSRGAAYVELESYIVAARNSMRKALRLAGAKVSPSEREQLRTSINNLRELVNLFDARIAGIKELDWDAELEKILAEV